MNTYLYYSSLCIVLFGISLLAAISTSIIKYKNDITFSLLSCFCGGALFAYSVGSSSNQNNTLSNITFFITFFSHAFLKARQNGSNIDASYAAVRIDDDDDESNFMMGKLESNSEDEEVTDYQYFPLEKIFLSSLALIGCGSCAVSAGLSLVSHNHVGYTMLILILINQLCLSISFGAYVSYTGHNKLLSGYILLYIIIFSFFAPLGLAFNGVTYFHILMIYIDNVSKGVLLYISFATELFPQFVYTEYTKQRYNLLMKMVSVLFGFLIVNILAQYILIA
jgi:hypothetical protein